MEAVIGSYRALPNVGFEGKRGRSLSPEFCDHCLKARVVAYGIGPWVEQQALDGSLSWTRKVGIEPFDRGVAGSRRRENSPDGVQRNPVSDYCIS